MRLGEKGITTRDIKRGVCPQCKISHRGLCHECVHDGKVAGDWSLSPCATCQPAEALQQGHGRHLSYDELERSLGEKPVEAVEPKPEDGLLDGLRAFLGLDAIGREICFRYLQEPESSLEAVANHLSGLFLRPFTLQAVHWRIRAMEKLPGIGRLLAMVDRRTLRISNGDGPVASTPARRGSGPRSGGRGGL